MCISGAAEAAPRGDIPSSQESEPCCSTAPARGQRHGWLTLHRAREPLMQDLPPERARVLWLCVHVGELPWVVMSLMCLSLHSLHLFGAGPSAVQAEQQPQSRQDKSRSQPEQQSICLKHRPHSKQCPCSLVVQMRQAADSPCILFMSRPLPSQASSLSLRADPCEPQHEPVRVAPMNAAPQIGHRASLAGDLAPPGSTLSPRGKARSPFVFDRPHAQVSEQPVWMAC